MPERAGDWGHPLGPPRARHLVWTGVAIILAGAVVAAVAVTRPRLVWLWIPAGILTVIGIAVLGVGRPRSTSRVAGRH